MLQWYKNIFRSSQSAEINHREIIYVFYWLFHLLKEGYDDKYFQYGHTSLFFLHSVLNLLFKTQQGQRDIYRLINTNFYCRLYRLF